MDGVQLSQGKSHFEEAIYFFPLGSQKSLVLILSTLQLPSGFFRKVWERYRDIYIERESPTLKTNIIMKRLPGYQPGKK